MISTNFTKTHLSYTEQIDLLESRGLIIKDKVLATKRLKHISYYRLSAYFLPFQQNKNIFNFDVRFEEILRLYDFDKALRKIIFDAIETIEVTIRADITYNLSKHTGAFGYKEKENLNIGNTEYLYLVNSIERETQRSKETFVSDFKQQYHSDDLPIWMVVEIISFSTLSKLFKALKSEQETMTTELNLPPKVLKNWLHVINHVRNICAHHGRLWNKQFVIKALIPKKLTAFENIRNDRVFMLIMMLNYMFKSLGMGDDFVKNIEGLLREYPEVPKENMGFTDDWQRILNEYC